MKTMIGIRVEPELKEALKAEADQENRTLSNYIVNVLVNHLKSLPSCDDGQPETPSKK
jgi:predicted HicB family RNase H-like nuclease